ncbi:MAG: biopolymer transporter Tol [Verrucomicrobiota bacterium]
MMRSNLLYIFLFTWACLLLGISPAPAQGPVITIDANSSIPISISASGELGEILKNDFSLSGATVVVSEPEAKFILTASNTGSGVNGTLKTSSGQIRVSPSFSGELRSAAHQLADAVIQEITGKPGIATSKVTFISKQSGKKEVYIMDIDGEKVRQITRDQSIALGPKFSPDGQRIAFTSYKSGYPDVWVIDLARSSKRSIAFFPGVNSGASFSPNGNTLALTLSKDGNTDLYTMPATGGNPTRIARTRGTEASPSWSPDGSEIIFVSDVRGSPQLYIVPAKGGSLSRLQTFAGYTTEPNWSPDGNFIAYSIMTAGQSQIAITDLRTKKQTIITSSGNNESPSWARDSRHLVFARSGKLYLCDTVTRKTTPLTRNISSCTEPNVSR